MRYLIQMVALSFLIGQSLEAQERPPSKKNSALTCSSETDLRESVPSHKIPTTLDFPSPWGVFASGSFIFWHASQKERPLAHTSIYEKNSGLHAPSTSVSRVYFQDFQYQPGFKLSIGTVLEKAYSNLGLGYTRLHQDTKTSLSSTTTENGPNLLTLIGSIYQVSNTNQPLTGSQIESKWGLHLDWIDLTLSCAIHKGLGRTVSSFGGLRTSLLNQRLRIDFSGIVNKSGVSSARISETSNSWGIGPRGGIQGKYLLGKGLSFEGRCGGSLLYTTYTKLKHREDPVSSTGISYPDGISFKANQVSALRPMAEGSIGLGLGGYSSSKKVYFNLSAAYEFNYLWAQNMFSVLNSWILINSATAPGDLSLHGLTVTGTIKF